MFKEVLQTVRVNYYPPCHHANKVSGLPPHCDAGGLTLLLQINEVEGLQIKKNGQWMPVKPLSNGFIANNGDTLEIMSDGKYKSIEHRVVINPQKERMSIATFVMPWLDVPIGPTPKLVEGSEELYQTLNVVDHLKLVITSKIEGKSVLDMMT
ncbi:Codeine 3-O-demethylase protein [Dioscorea alata]|uniref:Codeine 3-O-demethylase protein n=1 Tax=Dioscorea alata TaxID=55571 RepID=A0ACB7UFS5_DIOAL|nr:Codeine 3-O-demethylase protein [Dioscorea alata]